MIQQYREKNRAKDRAESSVNYRHQKGRDHRQEEVERK
jgi:hypothetical protein